MTNTDFSVVISETGVARITFDLRGRSMNMLNASIWNQLDALVTRVAENGEVRGAVIASGKSNNFCAGADLSEIERYAGIRPADQLAQRQILESLSLANRVARRIETCGKPFAAAITGLALGGGLELALACHYRVVADDPTLQLGLPEVTLGLLPGGGGTQRVVRLLGVEKAMALLTDGKSVTPAAALELGLIDAVEARADVLDAAEAWIVNHGDPVARWDRKTFALPGGTPYSNAGNAVFIASAARTLKATRGNYPAEANIARAVYEGAQLPIDRALAVETRYFVATLQTGVAEAMIRAFRSQATMRKAPATAERDTFKAKKVTVLGAGMMGAGIAYVLARANIRVTLLDLTADAAEKGKAYTQKILRKEVASGKMTEAAAAVVLERVEATDDYSSVTSSDVIIETVFEDVAIKAEATAKALAYASPDALFATNTSTLPIRILASAHPRPENFVGLHFHSPVDRMDLIEIVRGPQSSAEAVARARDFCVQIAKTAIVANDSPFFYTSRVFDAYIREGMEALVDGVSPIIIDQVAKLTGMPRGPLELSDDVAIDLLDRIAQQRTKLLGAASGRRRSDDVVKILIDAGRTGRKVAAGFYDYDGTTKTPWANLARHWPIRHAHASAALIEQLRHRFLHRQALEAIRCMSEGVLDDPRHADIGAILGWGFPRWTGGPLTYVDRIGLKTFRDECEQLERELGPRFAPPELLKTMIQDERQFYASAEALAA